MPGLVDTNVLVYRFDPRFPEKRRVATEFPRRGIAEDTLRFPHLAIVEVVSVVTHPLDIGRPLLHPEEARREEEEFLSQLPVLYPNEAVVRGALRGWASYGLSWFDAHLRPYDEGCGLSELFSEDFEHERFYGTIRTVNPFAYAPPRRPGPGRGISPASRACRPWERKRSGEEVRVDVRQ